MGRRRRPKFFTISYVRIPEAPKIRSTGDSALWKIFKSLKSRFTVIIFRYFEQNFRFQISEIIDDFSEHCL